MPDPQRSPELLEQLHRRSRAYLRTWLRARRADPDLRAPLGDDEGALLNNQAMLIDKLYKGVDGRAIIRECAGVDKIIKAVEAARRGRPLPKQPNVRRLRRGIHRAGRWHRTLVDIGPKQPWKGRRKRLDELTRWAAHGQKLLSEGDAGRWATLQLSHRRALPGSTASSAPILKMAAALREFEEMLKQVMKTTFAVDSDDPLPGKRPAGALLNEPMSALEWLIGEHLAELFEQEFGLRAMVNRSETGRVTRSPYVAFVRAVLDDLGIANSDGSPISAETVYTYRKQRMPKVGK